MTWLDINMGFVVDTIGNTIGVEYWKSKKITFLIISYRFQVPLFLFKIVDYFYEKNSKIPPH